MGAVARAGRRWPASRASAAPAAPALRTAAAVVGLVPVVVLVAMFLLWPIVDVILRSLDPEGLVSYSSPRVTLHNYTSIVTTPALRTVLFQTFELAALTAVLCAVLAFPTAYLMSRLRRRGTIVLLVAVLTAFCVSILVRLFALTVILGREGVVNTVLAELGLGGPYSLLFNTAATLIGMVNYLLPLMVLILYAAMANIDTSLTVAAKTLGASGFQAFRKVYFPLVRPALVGSMLLVFVLSLGFFLTPAVLGGPQNTTIPVFIQEQVSAYQWGAASATGVVLLVATAVGYVIALRAGATSILPEMRGSGSRGSVEREPLPWSPVSALLWISAGIVLVVVLAPLIVVIPSSFDSSAYLGFPPKGFTTTWYAEVFNDPMWTSALAKSARVALGTAVLSTCIGLALARLVMRVRSKNGRAALQGAIFAPLAVPVILLAIGVYDVEAKLGLLDTSVGLMLPHTIIAFPLAFAVLSNALTNLDPSLESAAWTLGASRARAFWRVVVPNIVPSLIGAFLISFITSWDEAVIALFQTGLEKTLPVTMLSLLKSGGVSPAVAAVATMLVGLVVIGLVFTGIVARYKSRSAVARRQQAAATAANDG